MEMTEERICECEDRTIEATLSKQQTGRKGTKKTNPKLNKQNTTTNNKRKQKNPKTSGTCGTITKDLT